MDILDKLKASNAAIRTVALGNVSVGLRILTEADSLTAQVATYQGMSALELELNVGTADAFDTESNSQLLARAIVDQDTGKQLFTSAADLRSTLSREQRRVLIAEYMEHEKEYSPMAAKNMPEAEFNALLDSLKKTPLNVDLSGLSSGTLRRLLLSLASPPAS